MSHQFFLIICLIGTALTAPTADNCEPEIKILRECNDKTRIPFRDYDKGDFQKYVPIFNSWVECVGKPTCKYVQKIVEKNTLKFNQAVFMSENLDNCLGNGILQKITPECFQSTPKPFCDDPFLFDCVKGKMENHKGCTQEAIKKFEIIFPDSIRYCHVKEELKVLREQL